MTQLVVPQFIVPPHPPAPPAVAGGAPQPAPQPEFTGTTGKPADADPTTTDAEPEHAIPIQRTWAERDTRSQDILQWKKEAFFSTRSANLQGIVRAVDGTAWHQASDRVAAPVSSVPVSYSSAQHHVTGTILHAGSVLWVGCELASHDHLHASHRP